MRVVGVSPQLPRPDWSSCNRDVVVRPDDRLARSRPTIELVERDQPFKTVSM